jgi:hypothetical protein
MERFTNFQLKMVYMTEKAFKKQIKLIKKSQEKKINLK